MTFSSGAVRSLRYVTGSYAVPESKLGHVIYDGNPEGHHHWLFRTKLKFAIMKTGDMPGIMQNVIENLRGRAIFENSQMVSVCMGFIQNTQRK